MPERAPLQAEITSTDRLGLTLFFALVAHALLVFGVTFIPEDKTPDPASTLEVVLVQQRSEKPPEEAEFLAQANQEGGGESDERARPSTPLPAPLVAPEAEIVAAAPPLPLFEPEPQPVTPAPPAPSPETSPATEPTPAPDRSPDPPAPAPVPVLAQTETARQKVATRAVDRTREQPKEPEPVPKAAASATTAARSKPAPAPEPPPLQSVNAAELVSRSLAMASLAAEIDQKLQAYGERPRHKWVTARTRESKYAAYMDAWRVKVERVGNLNYPDAARRQQLSGALLLDVALNADGTIHEIILRRSSGHRVLDDAAIRIVKLAAPYARFPDDIAAETDILHIERTWRFLSDARFSGG